MTDPILWFLFGWFVAHAAHWTARLIRGEPSKSADYCRGWVDAMHQEHPPEQAGEFNRDR
jgi:hypothetical protein